LALSCQRRSSSGTLRNSSCIEASRGEHAVVITALSLCLRPEIQRKKDQGYPQNFFCDRGALVTVTHP
jgi:hypothetical protein